MSEKIESIQQMRFRYENTNPFLQIITCLKKVMIIGKEQTKKRPGCPTLSDDIVWRLLLPNIESLFFSVQLRSVMNITQK